MSIETFLQIFPLKYVIIYLVAINIIGFLAMFIDKQKAKWLDKRRAKNNQWRIPEKTLFLFTFLGGGVGTIAGMYLFRHKTKKMRFTVGFPVILITEIALVIYWIMQ